MCAEAALVEVELPANQEDFEGLHLLTDGEAVRPSPADVDIGTRAIPDPLSPDISGARLEIADGPVILAAYTGMGKAQLPMHAEVVALGNKVKRIRLSDEAGILGLTFHFWSDDLANININMRYSEQPLDAALSSARFFEVLATTPGRLVLEAHEPNVPGSLMADLPLPIPGPNIAEHRDRLRLLEALHEIWRETGVEIRYPVEPEKEQDLDNLNFVLRAIRGGWVAQQVESINIGVAEADVRDVLEQLRENDEVHRAFIFDLPDESYEVFGKRVDLGPSRRYWADARLATTREEIESWLGEGPGREDTLPLRWESVDDIPVHIFFQDWPKASVFSIDRGLQEFEAIYGFSSEDFGRAWRERAAWARDIPDGKRWFSLIQAREELAQES